MTIKFLTKCGGDVGASFEYRPGYVFRRDATCTAYDWLVVFDEMPADSVGTVVCGCERLACPRECTMLLTWEPVSVKDYSRGYTRQFGHLLTNRPPEAEEHPHYHLGRGYYYWLNGRDYEENATTVIPPKTKLISAVCSSKRMRFTAHDARFRLISHLAGTIPDLAWFGRGVRPLEKKYEALDAYRYHVAVENHIGVHHWSEKIADALLCECLPFYAGDPDLGHVLPPESFIPIPIDDPGEAERIIRDAIATDQYAKRREAVLEAKRLLLTRYNLWQQIIDVIESERDQMIAPIDVRHPACLYNRKTLRRREPATALGDGLRHLARYFRGAR